MSHHASSFELASCESGEHFVEYEDMYDEFICIDCHDLKYDDDMNLKGESKRGE